MGGIFKAKSFYDSSEVEHAFMIVWGVVTHDCKVTPYNDYKAEIQVNYHSKSYMKCVAWGKLDSPVIKVMQGLEKGDTVICAGLWSDKPYTTKKGEEKHNLSLDCQIVIPMPLLAFIIDLYSSNILETFLNSVEADKIESAEETEETDDNQSENGVKKENKSQYDPTPPADIFESLDELAPF